MKETKPETIIDNLSIAKTWLEENSRIKTMTVDAIFMIRIVRTFETIGMTIEEITTK